MISRQFLARLLKNICKGLLLAGEGDPNLPFGGLKSCRAHHIELLRSLIITDPRCPPTDFNHPPWNAHVLITPHHAVRRKWNMHMTKKACQHNGAQLFICHTFDTIRGCPLTLAERFSVATKPPSHRGQSDERGGLTKEVMIAIGTEVITSTLTSMLPTHHVDASQT